MNTGTVKFFNETKGFGFILDSASNKEIFVHVSGLKEQRTLLSQEIDQLKNDLRNEDQIKTVDNRILALEEEEKTLAQQIADVEKTQFVIERFNKLKIDTLESKINEKFQFVKFRMFESLINGGETECCDALIDGVPFSDANTASNINAGLDIINTLCEFYQVTAPIFIDNRESIIDVIELNSQLINLIVLEDLSFSEDKLKRDNYNRFIDGIKKQGGVLLNKNLKAA